jgi:hypothetical protein
MQLKITTIIMKYLSIVFLFIALGCDNSETKAVSKEKPDKVEGYVPSQPIAFPHSLHSSMDCKYCHNSVDDSKNAELPSVNICMNCHLPEGDSIPDLENETVEEQNCSYLQSPNTPKEQLPQDCAQCHY